jgi:hypothetical protein
MSTPSTTEAAHAPSALAVIVRDQLRTAGARLGARRIAMVLGLAAVAAGIALSWGWLTAIGVAPVLVAAAPCAVMCALGLCMPRICGRSGASATSGTEGDPGRIESSISNSNAKDGDLT